MTPLDKRVQSAEFIAAQEAKKKREKDFVWYKNPFGIVTQVPRKKALSEPSLKDGTGEIFEEDPTILETKERERDEKLKNALKEVEELKKKLASGTEETVESTDTVTVEEVKEEKKSKERKITI